MYDREGDYLQIPLVYFLWLENVRWSPRGEAIEYADGQTFALSPQLALFLEGFAEQGSLLNFGHMLHLLHLLGYGKMERPKMAGQLAGLFAHTGRPLRNAGAFCAFLCRHVPRTADAIAAKQVCGLLWSGAQMADLAGRWQAQTRDPSEAPALVPSAFEKRFLETLSSLSPSEWDHWLRHGCGTLGPAPAQLARQIVPEQPRHLGASLEALLQRERLTEAVPYVAQLVSALALPPRRLSQQELPVGGYADVTTRGLPEQILPSQFALDDLEFVRRFAQKELLYFRREEPSRLIREELIVLLDQGVRTWGLVRLVLSAAVMAFGKLAARRKVLFRVAGTSLKGAALNPLEADDETLGRLLEASDLSANPGLALETILEHETDAVRDVVLLSHPRSLREADVLAAARRAVAPTRLFAVTVNERGQAELTQIRHGTPLPVRRFQVELTRPAPPKPPKPAPVAGGWTGDVEPIGFPFRFGISNAARLLFDFDHAGEWLLVASNHGMLHAFKLDGSTFEILPRGMVGGKVLTEIKRVRGVRGGFAVCGRIDRKLVVVHYDFETRRSKLHVLIEDLQQIGPANAPAKTPVHVFFDDSKRFESNSDITSAVEWFYHAELHSVVAVVDIWAMLQGGILLTPAKDIMRTVAVAVDLTTGGYYPARNRDPGRAQRACEASAGYMQAPPELGIRGQEAGRDAKPYLRIDEINWTLNLRNTIPAWKPICLKEEDKFALKGWSSIRACYRDTVLAVAIEHGHPKKQNLWLIQGPDSNVLHRCLDLPRDGDIALSSDGRLVACQINQTQVEVRETGSWTFRFRTSKGESHQQVELRLADPLMQINVGRWHHFLRWNTGELLTFFSQGAQEQFRDYPAQTVAARKQDIPACAAYDSDRFVAGCREGLIAVADRYGQLAVFDRAEQLLCMFFVSRSRLAGWMPDGTCFGPKEIIGSVELKTARHRFGQVLKAASEQQAVPP